MHIVYEQIEQRTKSVGDWREMDTPVSRIYCFTCAVRLIMVPLRPGKIHARVIAVADEPPICQHCNEEIPREL